MADPIISPDGKSMWSGTEWIPIPPSHDISLNDSVVQGDISISSQIHHHHQNEIINIANDSKICPGCGEESYNFSRRCFGIIPLTKFGSPSSCEAKGCDFCFEQFPISFGELKNKYFCLKCLKENKGNHLQFGIKVSFVVIVILVLTTYFATIYANSVVY